MKVAGIRTGGHVTWRLTLNRCFPTRRALLVLVVIAAAACSGGDAITGPSSRDPIDGVPNRDPQSGGAGATVNPLTGFSLYLDPNSNASRQAALWRDTRPADAAQMAKIYTRPQAQWFGGWLSDVGSAVTSTLRAAATQGSLPVLVAYNIPNTDCGSDGPTADGYRTWISDFAGAIGGARAVVILEPDALAAMGCLDAQRQQTRLDLLRYAIQAIKSQRNVTLYVDAGHGLWHSVSEMARRLDLVGIAAADGFALNVSNFIRTDVNTSYGVELSGRVGGKHFIIDTSRNGLGPTADHQWCNPPGRALGMVPTTVTANPLVDAYLWVKPPGESDAACNGGPAGGAWWPDYALELAQLS